MIATATATRFLTVDEKARELAGFAEYRRDQSHYRTAHPDAHGGEGWLDPEVLPLVDALNALDGVCTVQSCCGHRWPVPGDQDGAEYVHTGQLWLRLSGPVMAAATERVGQLLEHDAITYVQRIFAYQDMSEPHEVFDVRWAPGDLDDAAPVIVGFFRGLAT